MLVVSAHGRIDMPRWFSSLRLCRVSSAAITSTAGQHSSHALQRDVGEIPYGRWYNVQTAFQDGDSPSILSTMTLRPNHDKVYAAERGSYGASAY